MPLPETVIRARIVLLCLSCFLPAPAPGRAYSSLESRNPIAPVPVPGDALTGEKPQSKVWSFGGYYWSVFSRSDGTWVHRLDGLSWTRILSISNSTYAKADVKKVGDVAHILLHLGSSSSELVSIEFQAASASYIPWSLRPATVSISIGNAETATIDIDSRDRMWLASDHMSGLTARMEVRFSDPPYSNWQGPIIVASNTHSDDICVVTAMPDSSIGVLWSDQNANRFGFKIHRDGDSPMLWSSDEVPASQSAHDEIGGGMADDHLNVAVSSDGTLYAAVKTEYPPFLGYPLPALLIRRPDGTWDDLHYVDEDGTRGIVLLDEHRNSLYVVYSHDRDPAWSIVVRETRLDSIAFGPQDTIMVGGPSIHLNNATSMKENIQDEIVLLASTASWVEGILAPPSPPTSIDSRPFNPNNSDLSLLISPNPGRSEISLSYDLPLASEVNLSLYDVRGRLVSTLVSTCQSSGRHRLLWNLRADNGRRASPGVYFYHIRAGRSFWSGKLTIVE